MNEIKIYLLQTLLITQGNMYNYLRDMCILTIDIKLILLL